MRYATQLSFLRRSRATALVALAAFASGMLAPLLSARPAAAAELDLNGPGLVGTVATNGLATPQSSSGAWTGGLASVDATGAAHVSYPFTLPSARGGVQPQLALSYSSLTVDGDAGVGWSLSLPSIERRSPAGLSVPTFNDADPQHEPQIDWDDKDTFVYDGQPLVPVCWMRSGHCNVAPDEAMATASPISSSPRTTACTSTTTRMAWPFATTRSSCAPASSCPSGPRRSTTTSTTGTTPR